MTRLAAVLLLALAACQGRPAAETAEGKTPADTTAGDSLPPMPVHPVAPRGMLAAQSAGGPKEIRGEWAAEAGMCAVPAWLQLVSQVPGLGTAVLLSLPPANRATRYPVATSGRGMPEPPASQVAVQVFRTEGPAAYQAADGFVEIYALEKTLSGQFAVTLRQISNDSRIRYAGAFKEVPIKQMDPAYCARADSASKARP